MISELNAFHYFYTIVTTLKDHGSIPNRDKKFVLWLLVQTSIMFQPLNLLIPIELECRRAQVAARNISK